MLARRGTGSSELEQSVPQLSRGPLAGNNMRSTSIALLILILLSTSNGQVLRVWQNRVYYQNGERFQEVKSFKKEICLYGYGIVDSDDVFLAYQPDGISEAVTVIELIALSTNKVQTVGELGGTGESFFDYNAQNGYLVFNSADGIAILNLKNPSRTKDQSLLPKIIHQCNECYEVRWLDDTTIAFTVYDKGKWVLKKLQFHD
jgi:hypothetical protein